MVRLEIRAGFSGWNMDYEKDENNKVHITKYSNCYEISSATIEGVRYYMDDFSSEWRNSKTNRKLGIKQYEEFKKKVNEIINEGNEYFNLICNTEIKPAELN